MALNIYRPEAIGDDYPTPTGSALSSGGASIQSGAAGSWKATGGYSGLDGSMLMVDDKGNVLSMNQIKTKMERDIAEGRLDASGAEEALRKMGIDGSYADGKLAFNRWSGTINGKIYSAEGDALLDKNSKDSVFNQLNAANGRPVTYKDSSGKLVTVQPGAPGYPAPASGSPPSQGASSGGSTPTGGAGTATSAPAGKHSSGSPWGGGDGSGGLSLDGAVLSGGAAPGIDPNAPLGVTPRDPSYQKDPGGFSSPASFKSMGLGPESTFNDLVGAVLGIQEGRQQAAQSDLSQAYQKEQNDPLAQGVNAAAQGLLANPYSISDPVYAQMVGKSTEAINQRYNLNEQQMRDRAAAQGMGGQGTTNGAIDANRVANINAVSGAERDLAIERERLRKQEEQQARAAAGGVRGQEAAIRGEFTKMGQENLRGDTVGDALLLGQVVGNRAAGGGQQWSTAGQGYNLNPDIKMKGTY